MFLVDISFKVRKLANSDNYQVLKLAYFYEIWITRFWESLFLRILLDEMKIFGDRRVNKGMSVGADTSATLSIFGPTLVILVWFWVEVERQILDGVKDRVFGSVRLEELV